MADDSIKSLVLGLTPSQTQAVMADDSPLCVRAGAGSGKTSVLTRRVARRVLDGSASADHTLVVTFTRKAAGELRSRLFTLGVPGVVPTGTFHAAAYRQLRHHWADRAERPRRLLDDSRRVVGELLPADTTVTGAARQNLIGSVDAELHWAQARLIAPEGYRDAAVAAGRVTPLSPAEVAEIYARYGETKARRGLIDLDDLLTSCAEIIERDGTVAAAVRWRVRHLFVDEFQDVNPAQWRLLKAWLGDRDDLFVVGDPFQAVYSWNGADPTLFDKMPTLLPKTTVLGLDENHRCTPQVVRAACAVLGTDPAPTTRPDGPEPSVQSFEDDRAEADAVVRWLRLSHRPGRSWSQMAVLARTHARLEPLADALRSAGIPFRSSRGHGARKHSGNGAGPLDAAYAFLRALPRDLPLRAAIAELAVGSATALVPAVVRLADEHIDEAPEATAGTFVDWLAANDALEADVAGAAGDVEDSSSPSGAAVELATFHRAKGLQWSAVAVIGLEAGTVPIVYASTPAARAEERRLLYVALTRAEDELWCSWSRRRYAGEHAWDCEPSPYLASIGASAVVDTTLALPVAVARIAALRDRLPVAG